MSGRQPETNAVLRLGWPARCVVSSSWTSQMYRNDTCRRCDASCSSSPIKCVECDLACYCSSKCQADDQWRHEVDCQVAKVIRECSGCGASKKDTKRCGNCLDAWYCSKECQKKHWSCHKPECTIVSQAIKKLAKGINKFWSDRSFITVKWVYYWGNVPAVDFINLSLNEGSGYASPLSLLLCGVGDPRNVALSLASLPESYQEQLTFVLNDISVCTLARTVLLLYMLWEGGQEAAPAVTQIWYSLRITDHAHNLAMTILQRLIQATNLEELTRGVISVTDGHFKTLKRVWQKWLDVSSRDGAWVTDRRRREFDLDPEAQQGISNYLSAISSEHVASVKEWFSSGILLPKKSHKKAKRENVTLTGSSGLTTSEADVEFAYCVRPDCLPFTSWDYRDAKAFHNVPSLLEMYSKYVSHVLAKCASRLVSGQVKLHCILSNCLEMQPFLPDGLAFDRVLTTNLWDFIPLPTLLEMCKPLLNQANPSSVIVTETMNWCQHIQARVNVDLAHTVRALQDTGNLGIALSSGRTGGIEYYDLSDEFQWFLHAELLSADTNLSSRKKQIPPLKALASKRGLILRDYLRNGNQICPFKWPINCRRVTQLSGFERAVEWVLPTDK